MSYAFFPICHITWYGVNTFWKLVNLSAVCLESWWLVKYLFGIFLGYLFGIFISLFGNWKLVACVIFFWNIYLEYFFGIFLEYLFGIFISLFGNWKLVACGSGKRTGCQESLATLIRAWSNLTNFIKVWKSPALFSNDPDRLGKKFNLIEARIFLFQLTAKRHDSYLGNIEDVWDETDMCQYVLFRSQKSSQPSFLSLLSWASLSIIVSQPGLPTPHQCFNRFSLVVWLTTQIILVNNGLQSRFENNILMSQNIKSMANQVSATVFGV